MYGGYEGYGGFEGGYEGGYEGGWNPGTYLTGENASFPMTRYRNKAGHDYLDFKQWALEKEADTGRRDKMLQNIYLSAKAMKFHPQITKDLRKTYGLVASAAMRAMSPSAKFEIKKAMSPYSELKKAYAQRQAAAREEYGMIPRKGLAGRIGYWNAIQATDIDDLDAALQDLYGVEDTVTKKPEFKAKDMYNGTYAEYKAALKRKTAARRDYMSRMSEPQRKKYKHQLRVLQAARAAIKAARKADRENRKTAADLVWGQITPTNWARDYKQAITAAIAAKGEKYADVNREDIYNVMTNPKASLFRNFQTANPGVLMQESRNAADNDMGALSLTSRAPVNWKEAAVPQGENMEED